MSLRCTSCNLSFETSTSQRDHYRQELHRYNLKRRTIDLPPVNEGEFNRRKVAAQSLAGVSANEAFHAKCQACNRSFSSRATLEQHKQSKKHLTAIAAQEANGGMAATKEEKKATSSLTEGLAKVSVAEEEVEATVNMEEVAAAGEAEEKGAAAAMMIDLMPEVCIFCDKRCDNMEVAVLHMWKAHGFHIPDAEYLVDLRGLLRYVAEKVKVGCICLYCNGKGRSFATPKDVQRHMESKCHCKLRYEEGEDLHEFRPFYNFSASYTGLRLGLVGKGEEEEDDDDDLSLETAGSDFEEMSEDDGEEAEGNDDAEEMLKRDALYMSDLGELVLPDGRALGRRDFKVFYKQRYRPEDSRTAVIASKIEASERSTASSQLAMLAPSSSNGVLMAGSADGWVHQEKALVKAVLRVNKAARRYQEKMRLRVERNRNKFHKRPQIDG